MIETENTRQTISLQEPHEVSTDELLYFLGVMIKKAERAEDHDDRVSVRHARKAFNTLTKRVLRR